MGSFNFEGIPPAPPGVPRIQFRFEIAADGVPWMTAEDLGNSRKVMFPRMQLAILKQDQS